ncbi:Maf family protein [Chrysiogenes arsenatis]|uniref:Maf family protein n=1 Tax=Chrysiogenes arsenatis TaxID=309797 RepID=UPI00042845BB|nr:Maf family protein [Chrysiogenes arsenatis]
MSFILASASPRRSQLLQSLGWEFVVRPSHVAETTERTDPADIVVELAARKAQAVIRDSDSWILGADTIVVLDNRILEKPADRTENREMLRALSGRTHTVYGGIALVCPRENRTWIETVATQVTFHDLSDAMIEWYVESGSGLDKAGGYGIQDRSSIFVASITGCYDNVVGLSRNRLYAMACQSGLLRWMEHGRVGCAL